MDNLTKKQRSKCMSRIRSKNTEPERRIRKLLTAENIKYRLHASKLPGKPDIAVYAKKIAIFINGCFWHQHKHCKYAVMPKSNLNYWKTKLEKNTAKQKGEMRQLRKIGWKPIVIWECQVEKQMFLDKIINRIKNEKNSFKFAELFCGPGGLGLGALLASVSRNGITYNIKPVWANDIDEDACRTYAKNIHDGDSAGVICSPVEKINFEKVPAFDALAFGFPCNDFSVVGEQKGFHGKYGPLYTYGVKAINAHNPMCFIAENVSGLQSANNGGAFTKILEDLEKAGKGYNLTAHLYKFEEYGVPQYRRRVVIVGIRKDLGLEFKVPAPTTPSKHKTARQALEEPPIPPDAPNNETTRQSEMVVERLKHIPPGENAWYEGIPEHLRLNVKKARMSQIYKRLHPDRPAYTITGSGGGGTHVYHWSENRALTNRERARLQSFPDSFIFEGSKESVRKQIGMAVSPKAAQVIIEAVLKTLANIPYEWVPAKTANGNGNGNRQEALFGF